MSDWAADSVIRKKVDELIPYERNPRIHPQAQIDQLAQSIREWGWTMPILIDEGGNVIAGHGRLFAAKQMNIDEVPCVTATGWSQEKKKAYVIADNKLSESGRWDDALYFSELRSLSDTGFDLTLVGMEEGFAFDDFEPNLEPTANFRDVSSNDLDRASSRMADQISGLQSNERKLETEVMCPYCAETFTFTGN